MDKSLIGLLLLALGHGVSPVIHSLDYFGTVSSGLKSFPEFVSVGMVDGVQINYYDSIRRRAEPKQTWMDQLTRDHPVLLDWETQGLLRIQKECQFIIFTLKQAGGAHTYQTMYGCKWDDEDNSTGGYFKIGFDGKDFLVFDLETLRWNTNVSQVLSYKIGLDQDKNYNEYWKNYLTKDCVDWLKKNLDYGKNTFQRTECPQVSLLQRTPSSPVGCHATGFYPNRTKVFWTRDGQEVYEGVDHGSVLPNHDGTFQVSVNLDLTSVPKEDWGRYQCVVQLKGNKDLFTPLDPAHIRTNWVKTGLERDGAEDHQSGITTKCILIVFVVLLLVAAFGLVLYKRRNDSARSLISSSGSHPSSGSETSSETTDGQNPAPEDQPLTTG